MTNAELIADAMEQATFLDMLATDYRADGNDAPAETAERSANLLHDLCKRVKFGEVGA